ncbi:beta-glucuronidase [Myceligenerans pegani]|uniref:Beta-glucuronidase n=1 Tax=Myceligenerans pegani TaxID=2776917 RepID=A0ABR9N4T9_9MICO|nr:beta-glucuronidase [Myceligenerans sp. TRM 65318]MBE1878291.1 beta-glucuronidase [Myceligenerans sp. TRM 65318]MBE3020562.1 beta-glucuronidase [Myceligenerans sp. TRM 65318]
MLRPRITATREQISLDGLWAFATDAQVPDQAHAAPLDTKLEAAVPASYNDQFADPAIRDHVGRVFYQREVRVPRGWGNQRVLIRFDAATHAANVYVNDLRVGEHVGGYTPFDVDVTDHVTAGETFRLTVAVDNRLTRETIPPGTVATGPDGTRSQKYLHDFYNYAGLARSVRLHSVPRTHVSDVTVVTGYEGSTGRVDYTVELSGSADVLVTLRDEAGNFVTSAAGATGTLEIADVTLWQPGAGYLYDLTVELRDGSHLVDEYTLPVGVRTVEVRGSEFLINCEPFYFKGFGKHEDTPVRGKGHDNAFLVHDFQLLDWIGANSFRTSHYPYAEEVLEFADRHGMVVIDETAAVGLNMLIGAGISTGGEERTFGPEVLGDPSRDVLAQHVRELIARDRNHPSVVMWSLINEPASNEDGSREYFEPIVELARELDPTRPLTYSIVMFANAENDRIVDLFDVISLNRYYGWYVVPGDLRAAEQYLRRDLASWEKFGKPVMMTEYGADTQPGAHSVWDGPWTEEYQANLLAMYHRVFDDIPYFVGEQVWNFADFQTSNGTHRVEGNKKGVFTRDRKPKAAAHELRRRWTSFGDGKPKPQE